MPDFYKIITIFLAGFLLAGNSYGLILNDKKNNFLAISDIHFDPFYSCEKTPCKLALELKSANSKEFKQIFEKYNNDQNLSKLKTTNYYLFKLSLKELNKIANNENPQFVLVLGDMLAHQYKSNYRKYTKDYTKSGYEKFTKKIFEFLTLELNTALPRTNIYPAVGNHDSYKGNYIVAPNGKFFRETNNTWSSFIKTNKQKQEFLKQFKYNGYYAIDLNSNFKLIMLNTVLFSPKSQNSAVRKAANEQLIWLTKQLKQAKNNDQKVLIAGHIPISLNLDISIIMPYKLFNNFWKQKYSKRFSTIAEKYSDLIVAFLPGHVHIDNFQFSIPNIKDKYIPIIFTPSISPNYGSNPAIKEFVYDPKDFHLLKFKRYYLPLDDNKSSWQHGTKFGAIYYENRREQFFKNLVMHLTFRNYSFNLFTKYYSLYNPKRTDDEINVIYFWCGINTEDFKDYQKCISNK